jgi:hypothetical protein
LRRPISGSGPRRADEVGGTEAADMSPALGG